MKDFFRNSKIKSIQIIIAMLLFLKIASADISSCTEGESLASETCFNNLIKIENYRAGQFGEDNQGNLFLLYSHSSVKNKRLFYGLKDNGRNYFGDSEKKEIETTISGSREESKIIFITPKESSDGQQYLFSTSAGKPSETLAEFYNIGEDDIIRNSNSKFTNSFFTDIGSDEITSSQYSLIKLPDQNKYFIAFAQDSYIRIKKFEFNGPTIDNYNQLGSTTATYSNSNSKTISFFLMEDEQILVLYYMKYYTLSDLSDNNLGTFTNYSKIFFYSNDDYIRPINEEEVPSEVAPVPGDFFFKGLDLSGNYSALIFSCGTSGDYYAKLNISKLRYESGDYDSSNPYYTFDTIQEIDLRYSWDLDANLNLMFNEFIKINNGRLVFITTEGKIVSKPIYLTIVLIDISGEDYSNINPHKYYHFLGTYNLQKEISAFIYNGFLVFSGTYNNGVTSNYNSLLVFFGYPYGTDTTINLYPYLNDVSTFSTAPDKNIYTYLMDNMHLGNNIFGYVPDDNIRLITIPEQISFYSLSASNAQGSSPLASDSFLVERHILEKNQELNAEQYFDLEYQYIVKESSTSSNLYFGRTNRLTFNIDKGSDSGDSGDSGDGGDIDESGDGGDGEDDGTGCTYEKFLNNECQIEGTDEEIIIKVTNMIKKYKHFTKTLSAKLSQNHFIEITNDMKEILFDHDSNLSWVDLGKCADKIRSEIPSLAGRPLIILKFGASSDSAYENYVIFKIFDPDTFKEIPLSICKDINIDLYVDTKMPETVSKSVEEMVDQGYNPFDLNDKFYREICTPYESPDGTDVLLDDREEYFYSQLNTVTCPDGCGTSAYPLDTKYLKCECPVEDDVRLDLKHISGDNVKKSIKSTFKNSNWKAMLCYNLVFDGEIFGKNIGAIITLILFFIYICFFVYYVMEGITPLQNNVAAEKKAQDKEKNPAVISFKNPPKKSNSGNDDNKDKISSGILIDDKKDDDIKIVTLKDNKNEKRNSNPSVTDKDLSKIHIKKDSNYSEEVNLNVKKVTETVDDDEKYKDLDDFQLNNLEYKEACRYDKRSFLKTYWSVLKREHIVIFTFISRNDYNLFYVKIERFLILLCTQMFMNGLFFTDDSMHKATKSTDYSFVQQLPKIIFSLIGTHIIEVFLCYLSMTDTVMYEVKDLTKRKHTEQVIAEKINTMKKKLIAYFIVTLLLFAFYWYFVAAFCAVFQNTQKIFLLDFLIGTLIGYIDPFVIYLLKEILRYLSLTKLSNRKGEIVYKISDLIPIF